MTTIKGTIEVYVGVEPDHESKGFPVLATDPETIPTTAAAFGYVQIESVAPIERGTRTPVAEWTAVTAEGEPVRIILWEDVPFDDTLIGRALFIAKQMDVQIQELA